MAEWKILNQVAGYGDTTGTSGAVTFAPGANREWRVISAQVKMTTESSGGNRYPKLQIRDSGGTIIQQVSPNLYMAESDTKFFLFGVGLATMSAWQVPDTTILTTAIPPLFIQKDHDIRFALQGDKSDDTFLVNLQVLQRSTM